MRETRNLVLTAAVIDVLDPKSCPLDLREFWKLGLASAISARRIARDVRYGMVDQAYLGALVHSMGEAVLAVFYPDRFLKAIDEARDQGCSLVESVWAEFGFTHPALARLVKRSHLSFHEF